MNHFKISVVTSDGRELNFSDNVEDFELDGWFERIKHGIRHVVYPQGRPAYMITCPENPEARIWCIRDIRNELGLLLVDASNIICGRSPLVLPKNFNASALFKRLESLGCSFSEIKDI
jgi:hypothetical protein